MKNSCKLLDVYEFDAEDELTETTTKRINSKFKVSGGAEMVSKDIASVICGSANAVKVDYNQNAANEPKCSLDPVLRNNCENHEQSAEMKSTYLESQIVHHGEERISIPEASVCLDDHSNPVFPEITFNNKSVNLNSDADEVMSQRSSSATSDNSASSDGPSSHNYFRGLDMDEDADTVGIVLYPDYIDFIGKHYLDQVVTFYKRSVGVRSKTSYGNEENFHIHLEMDDIIKIESQRSAQYGTVAVNIYSISNETQSGLVENASGSGIQELRFPVIDSNWHKKLEAIESLNTGYKTRWDILLDTGMEKCSVSPAEQDLMSWRSSSSSIAMEKYSILPAGKALMPPRRYFPKFDRHFDEVIYPKGDPDAVSVSMRDVDLLRPDTFVNDTIIDFYIKYLKKGLTVEEKTRSHFFNSFFFRKLADMDKDPSSAFDGKAAFLRVRKWTRKVNMLEKDFIFIPVNYNYHWSLLVICYFGDAVSYEDVDGDKSVRVPCILHMDSIKGSHDGLKDLMQSYLWEEWKERQKETYEDLYSKFRNLKFVSLELPQQQNSYDCGLFLLHYIELFLEEVSSDFNLYKLSSSSKFLQANWFQPGEASLKRVHIERLIDGLLDTQSENSSPYKESDVHCSSDNPNTNCNHKDGMELSAKSSPMGSSLGNPSSSGVGQGIEMTLLPASSLRNAQCTKSTGLVLKELLESETAPESFDSALWGNFQRRGSIDKFKRSVIMIEEVETSECFVQPELAEPAYPDLDGINTETVVFPCPSEEFRSEHAYLGALSDSSDSCSDVSEINAGEKCPSDEDVELLDTDNKLKCNSSVIMECPNTVSFDPDSGDMLLGAKSCAFIDTGSEDMFLGAESREQIELKNASLEDRVDCLANCTEFTSEQSEPEADDEHPAKRMRIGETGII